MGVNILEQAATGHMCEDMSTKALPAPMLLGLDVRGP
jgi:hypothetical protein